MRAARPAIVAAAVLATARALGEAIMLSMVSGSVGFAPNPLDGLTFLFEPARPLAAAIVDNAEGLSVVPFGQTLYAFAAVLLVSSVFLSLGRLGRHASRCADTGCGRERDRRSDRRAPRARDLRRPPRQRPRLAAARPHRLCAAWAAGLALHRDRRRDRHLHGLKGVQYFDLSAAHPEPQRRPRPERRAAASSTR